VRADRDLRTSTLEDLTYLSVLALVV